MHSNEVNNIQGQLTFDFDNTNNDKQTSDNDRMKELVNKLNEAAKVYYQGSDELISNFEYDALYDELQALEEKTGVVLAASPTNKVGYEVLSELPKQEHAAPMLSLDKTKEVTVLREWLGNQTGLMSWKMDGLTVVLTYENGKLYQAVTRGNGIIGEVITSNAKVFKNIPLTVPFKGHMVLRGEAVIPYSEFNKLNEALPVQEQYKNPRNLCSGSVRQLDSRVTAKRNVYFYAFSLVEAYTLNDTSAEENTQTELNKINTENAIVPVDFHNSQEEKYVFMASMGFDVVEYKKITSENIEETVKIFSEKISTNDFPSDGLVLLMNDIAYGASLGRTAKFPKNAIAFKWKDETADTKLLEIEWSASRTGLINPVAIFEPVELEGTTVSRASVHNVSIVRQLKLGIGDTIRVYKANMIIPQIAENLTNSDSLVIPDKCPVCGGATQIKEDNLAAVLMCTNKDCTAKKLKSFVHFVGRDAMNVDGMSQATLEKFIAKGIIKEPADIFNMAPHREAIIMMDGFGQKAFDNLVEAAAKASQTDVAHFIYSLGIAGVGLANAKLISKELDYDFDKIRHADFDTLNSISGIGEVIAHAFIEYFNDPENNRIVDDLLKNIVFEKKDNTNTLMNMNGLVFVITGSLEHFTNRNELKEIIEEHGGKVTGSVTGKTTALINNDTTSSSSKNKKAHDLGVKIISENDFMEEYKINPTI